MGETDETQGDVKTLEAEKGKTPEQTQTFTKEEVEARIAKAENAVKTDVGRLTAELRRSQEIANAAIIRLKEREEEDYRKQEEAARDDPDELTRIRKRKRDADRAAELEEKETRVKTQLTKVLEATARTLSKEYNVTSETLLKYGGEDADSMEELAKSYGERTEEGESKGKLTKRVTEPPDDGKTKGGSAGLTGADVSKMSPEERHKRASEIAALPF